MNYRNLFSAYNKEENFRLLVRAHDKQDALELAIGYAKDTGLSGQWSVSDLKEGYVYSCDYIIQRPEDEREDGESSIYDYIGDDGLPLAYDENGCPVPYGDAPIVGDDDDAR